MRFILSEANFSGTGKNIGTLNSWFISKNTPSGLTWTSIPSSVDKGSNFNAVAEIDTANYELVTISVTMGATTQSGVGTSGGITISKSGSRYTITISSVTANVNINVTTKSLSTGTPGSGGSSGGGGTPTPTTYIFTVNPTPSTATVTLSATGYSTVSGAGSKSITVANGTIVNWSVSASGYTTRTGNWTISGGNKTENITLTAAGGESNVVFDFDFTTSTLANYANQGIFTVPNTSAIDTIIYDTSKGANLNNNLPYGLTLTNPIDASRPWTLEFTVTMATPTNLTGNRRAFITGVDDLAPFVVINGNGSPDKFGFQISSGSHTWVGVSQLLYDQEVTYKLVHDGNNTTTVYQNGTELGNSNASWTGKQFGTILGVIKGKSSAYTWKDVEEGKKSYLKKFKFYYN